eukprot:g5819.t1
MFRHLERPSETCRAPREDRGEKVFLIVGYDCCLMRGGGGGGGEGGEGDGSGEEGGGSPPIPTTTGSRPVGGQSAATSVLKAMGIDLDRRGDGDRGGDNSNSNDYCVRPGGFSQASSVGSRTCPLLAQEAEVSATADTICLKAPTTVPTEGVRAWLDGTNAALDENFHGRAAVRVLGRMVVPPNFHAEIHAKRRRYEYLIPAWMLDETAQGPWPDGERGEKNLIPLLRRLRGKGLKPFGHCSGDHAGKRRRCPLWHNFSATALPHSPSALRRLYRFFAMEVVRSSRRGDDYVCLSINGDAFMSQQVRGMVALAIAGARGLVSAADIEACIDPTRQEDLLPVPLAPAVPCWLAEVGYSQWQMRLGVKGGSLCMSPGAEQRACLPLEGWSDEASRSEAAKFRRSVLDSAALWWEDQEGVGAGWLLGALVPGALKLRRELEASEERATAAAAAAATSGANVTEGEGEGGDDGNVGSGSETGKENRRREGARLSPEEVSSLKEAPAAYLKVLRLLREADASGEWPYSTASRNLVILGDGADKAGAGDGPDSDNVAAAAASAKEIGAVDGGGQPAGEGGGQQEPPLHQPQQQQQQQQREGAGGSGSFTLGSFPPACPPPRGNRLFPELARAAFELEATLLPNRPPSTTIAVNRNAQFKPHVDSGAGAGQSQSLIVGLGDYKRGELVVEGEEVDIRYSPLEFNGWTQRHWTRPFSGERYSLFASAAAAPTSDDGEYVLVNSLSSCGDLLRHGDDMWTTYIGRQLTVRGSIDCRHTPPQFMAFVLDTVVRSTEPLEITDAAWILANGARITVIAPSVTMRQTKGHGFPLIKGNGKIEFRVSDDPPPPPGMSRLVDAFNLVQDFEGALELSTNGVISFMRDTMFVAASQVPTADDATNELHVADTAHAPGRQADPPSGSTSDDVDATMPPSIPSPAAAPDGDDCRMPSASPLGSTGTSTNGNGNGNGNGGEGNGQDRTGADASPNSGSGRRSGSGKDRRDDPGDKYSSSDGGKDGGKDGRDNHYGHNDNDYSSSGGGGRSNSDGLPDVFPSDMKPHSGTSLKVGEKLTGALLSPSGKSAIYVDWKTGIIIHSTLYVTDFGHWGVPVPVTMLKPNRRKFQKTLQLQQEIEEERSEEEKWGGKNKIQEEDALGYWPWGKGRSRDRRAKEEMKKHAGEIVLELSDRGILTLSIAGRTVLSKGAGFWGMFWRRTPSWELHVDAEGVVATRHGKMRLYVL